MSQRIAGMLAVQVNGEVFQGKGNWSYNLGRPMREAIVGTNSIHGFKETPQVPFIEGEITDRGDLDLSALVQVTRATVTLRLGNGKMVVLRRAWFAGEGTANTEESNVEVRFEGLQAEEVAA